MKQDEYYIRQANLLAKQAIDLGDEPFSAILVVDGKVVSKSNNKVIRSADPLQHAEMEVIRNAQDLLKTTQATNITLYSSTEPCPMCAGAIYWAGIQRVVFGCSVERFADICDAGLAIQCRSILSNKRKHIEVIGPVLEEESANIHLLYKSLMAMNT